MRDPKRIDKILSRIREEWKMHPDQRLGQILVNYFGYSDKFLFHKEDDSFGVKVYMPKKKPDMKDAFSATVKAQKEQ